MFLSTQQIKIHLLEDSQLEDAFAYVVRMKKRGFQIYIKVCQTQNSFKRRAVLNNRKLVYKAKQIIKPHPNNLKKSFSYQNQTHNDSLLYGQEYKDEFKQNIMPNIFYNTKIPTKITNLHQEKYTLSKAQIQYKAALIQMYERKRFELGFNQMHRLADTLKGIQNQNFNEIRNTVMIALGNAYCQYRKIPKQKQNKVIQQQEQVYYCYKSITRQGFTISPKKPPLPRGVFNITVQQINELSQNYWEQQLKKKDKTVNQFVAVIILLISIIFTIIGQITSIIGFSIVILALLIHSGYNFYMMYSSTKKTIAGYQQLLNQFLKIVNKEYQKKEYSWHWHYNSAKQRLQIYKI